MNWISIKLIFKLWYYGNLSTSNVGEQSINCVIDLMNDIKIILLNLINKKLLEQNLLIILCIIF